MDMAALKKWGADPKNQYLLEGTLFLTQKGIEICIPAGKINNPSFTIEDIDGNRIALEIGKHEEVFHVHREIVHAKEWVISLDR
jgi:hypothetical protein